MPSADHCERLERVVGNLPAMVVVSNRRREIEWVNPAYTEITGWTLAEVRGKRPHSFLHGPMTSAGAVLKLAGLLRRGVPVKDFHLLNYKKSGQPYWVSLSIQPVFDDSGELAEYVAIQSDITERKQREQELSSTLLRLARTQRLARIGHIEHDLASGSVHCSAEIYRILEADESEVESRAAGLLAFTHPDDAARVRQEYASAINAGEPYESEHRVVSRGGRVRWVHVRGALEGWDDGTPAVCRIAVQDITQRREAEQNVRAQERVEQTSRAQMDMMARVGQELRAPVEAVAQSVEALERTRSQRTDASSIVHLAQVRRGARHLQLIAEDILHLARLHEGLVAFDLHAVELHTVAQEVLGLLDTAAAGRGLSLQTTPGITPLFARADRVRLVQALVHLVGQALRLSDPGGSIRLRCEALTGELVALAVQDAGWGITPEHADRLFEPFYSPADLRRDPGREDGSGLALSIARSTVRAMGGDIEVRSSGGQGCSLRIVLPRAARPAAGADLRIASPTPR